MAVQLDEGGQWLNFHHLHYFLVIASQGSLSKAAAQLRVGQPALSTQLRLLEDGLGVLLFERRKQRLILTPAGRLAMEYAEEIFRLGSEMVDALHDRLPDQRMRVQVGVTAEIPSEVLEKIDVSARRWGDCLVSLRSGELMPLLEDLSSHRLDVVVCVAPPPDSLRLHSRKVMALPLKVINFSTQDTLTEVSQLAEIALVMPAPKTSLRQTIDHYLRVQNIKPRIVAEVQDEALRLRLAQRLKAATVIVGAQAGRQFKDGRPLPLENLAMDIWMLTEKRKVENPVAAHLLSLKEWG